MNCNLTDNHRIKGFSCRSWNCVPCKNFRLSANDLNIIDTHRHNMDLKKQNTELQAKLDLAVEALKYFDEVLRIRKSFKIEELEYKAITTLTEILEL